MYVTSPIDFLEKFPAPSVMGVNWAADDAVAKYSHEGSFRKGQAVFRDGDVATSIYEVTQGVVRMSKMLPDGRRQVLSFGYKGDTIGFSHNDVHGCDCEALSDVKLRVVHKNAYSNKMAAEPELCIELLRRASAEVNNMQEHFMMLGQKSAMEKIASFLTTLHAREADCSTGDTCFDLPMSRSDIADFLGLTIETVSRCLTKLRKKNIIELPESHRVCVRNLNALQSYAERVS